MKKLEKFKNESLELNKAINVKGGRLEETGGCTDKEITGNGTDVYFHHYDDNGKYLGKSGGKF